MTDDEILASDKEKMELMRLFVRAVLADIEPRMRELEQRVEKFSQLAQRWLTTSEYNSEQLRKMERMLVELAAAEGFRRNG